LNKKKSSEHDITFFDKSKPIKTTKQEGQELSIEQEGSYTTDIKREREKTKANVLQSNKTE
jgi:hypothetical protein